MVVSTSPPRRERRRHAAAPRVSRSAGVTPHAEVAGEDVLDLLPEAFGLLDAEGRLLHANGRLVELLGRPRQEVVGAPMEALVAEDAEAVREVAQRWRGSSDWRPGGLTIVTGDGTTLEVQCRGARLPATGVVLLHVLERTDAVADFAALNREVEVNNLRRMEARLQSSLAELSAVNQRLEAVNAELDRYASMVAHDIRTPFNAIARFTEILVEDHHAALPDDARQMLDAVARLADRGQEVTDALLSLARIGVPERVPEGSDSNAIAARVRGDLEALVESSGAEITIGDLPTTTLQPVHLDRILTNLLANALKYRSSERRPVIVLEGRVEGERASLTVADNGIGIPEDEREGIFEPLVRGRAAMDRPGTGVGLATCRKIVEAYGGEIAVLDTPGPGATIGVTLPAAGPPVASPRQD